MFPCEFCEIFKNNPFTEHFRTATSGYWSLSIPLENTSDMKWLKLTLGGIFGVVVITTAQFHSTKTELRFCAGLNPARGVLEIHDGEDLWLWSRREIRLNTFCRSTIPQKQFIIIIIIFKGSFWGERRLGMGGGGWITIPPV